jgi:hypothetical protein
MATLIGLSKRVLEDLRHGRHREAYALFLIGAVLAVLGLVGVASDRIILSTILLALSFLVFQTAAVASDRKPAIDQVLGSREDFGTVSSMLRDVKDLRIYGPTAVHILVNIADIRRFVLNRNGTVRVIVQHNSPETLALTALQLDDSLDLKHTLEASLVTLNKLAAAPRFSYRTLAVNPGFSLVIVNANDRSGYLIFESHGFRDENITDRMHIKIRRSESSHWFDYWVARFDAMWETAQPAVRPDRELGE